MLCIFTASCYIVTGEARQGQYRGRIMAPTFVHFSLTLFVLCLFYQFGIFFPGSSFPQWGLSLKSNSFLIFTRCFRSNNFFIKSKKNNFQNKTLQKRWVSLSKHEATFSLFNQSNYFWTNKTKCQILFHVRALLCEKLSR